jgi:hypothetical protein
MVNEEILGGLTSALERGEPLKRAMVTLYNSGYKKEEIEECARMLVEFNREAKEALIQPVQTQMPSHPIRPVQGVQPQFPQTIGLQKPELQVQKTLPSIRTGPVYVPPVQRISDYGGEITSREKAIILILIILLVFLVVILGLIFLFKQQIIDFFGNFFSQ